MSITRFLGPNAVPGFFGDQAVQRAKAAGLSDAQINQQVAAAGLQRASNAQIQQTPQWQQRQAAAAPLPSAVQFQGANAIPGLFGDEAYGRAKAAGLSDAQINQMLAASGLQRMSNAQIQQTPQWQERQRVQQATVLSAQSRLRQEYESRFQTALGEYEVGLQQARERYSELEGKVGGLQNEVSSANAAREEARARADAIEKQRKEELDLSVSSQLSGLRSGSTVTGTPGAGLGSLSSGRVSTFRTNSSDASPLTTYLRNEALNDSVLNRKGPVVEVMNSNTSGGGSSEARRRTLTGGAASYYASRFG